MTLYRLVYRSECAFSGDPERLAATAKDIAAQSKARNAALGVTGALMLSDRNILQAIEGPLEAVEAVFESICGDRRHRNVHLVELVAAPVRSFEQWSMAVITTDGGLASLCGSPNGFSGERLDPASVDAMLQFLRALVISEAPDVDVSKAA